MEYSLMESKMKKIFLTLLFLLNLKLDGTCYSDWSRCSEWSQVFTGYLWLSCNDRCQELGHRWGQCETRVNSCWFLPRDEMVYACICYND
jgi:hypothetical protein